MSTAAAFRGWRTALVLSALCLACGAWAASVQVDVQDAAGQPLGGAVVYLESAEARRQVRPLAVQEVSQENKQFIPDVQVLTVGTEVRFPNRDTVRHHVYSFSPAKKFELKLYAGTPAQPVLFDRPGVGGEGAGAGGGGGGRGGGGGKGGGGALGRGPPRPPLLLPLVGVSLLLLL